MIADDQSLDEPFDIGEFGAIDIGDVTQALGAHLRGADVINIRALVSNGSHVGVQLGLAVGDAFHIWVDGDELYWGDGRALLGHDWPYCVGPTLGEKIQY